MPLLRSTPWRLSRLSRASQTRPNYFHRPSPSPSIPHPYHHHLFSSSSTPPKRPSLRSTKIEWHYIPIGLGIAIVAITHLRSRTRSTSSTASSPDDDTDPSIRPMGPWQVHVLSTLPLKALSCYWGRFNEIPLPRALRAPGFKLYGWVFGVNMDEVEKDDLREYANLAEFFYRRLKKGARPIDGRAGSVASPADGRVLQFGVVEEGGRVGGVKGMEYSLDALLGGKPGDAGGRRKVVVRYEPGGGGGDADSQLAHPKTDASTPPTPSSISTVTASLSPPSSWWSPSTPAKSLYFAVIYLAPGDYHRFHSPTNWLIQTRRHFPGELYSVSPYLQSRLPGLFTLNERVVLLGKWRYGMFSMTPVGATNVGSIKVHFDRELRTNSLTRDVTGGKGGRGFAEATYEGSSKLLGGYPMVKGGEMGGFNLGSTIVLVFEAPAGGKEGKEGFRFLVKRGQRVKFGEALGVVE
ncbi:phosphatidylserine decarboxylase [Choiromyces venosus 120613-1]|uniref:Phosphatidylserine decarboxylase proenzyme 1, mitochondrial n=1 Tax=Choiromyces venosus 120613-1 TaxID=1336337 RepID=A0A3N4JRR5_9PEZI|nr:phosphatidylserine decarboxylase [Choiromyces venosus 120613-1]